MAIAQKDKPADYGISSKKALKYYQEGMLQTRYRDRAKAMEAFKEAVALEPDFAHANFQLGVTYYAMHKFDEALPHFEKATSQAKDLPMLDFYLGESYFYNEEYAKAVPAYEAYLDKGRGLKVYLETAAMRHRKASYATVAMQKEVKFTPVNLGSGINSEEDEYFPYLTADDGFLLFTSRRSSSTGGYSRYLKGYPEDFFTSSRKEGGKWEKAKNLGAPVNTPDNEGASCISQDGRWLFFTACNYPDGLGSCDIYYSIREGDRWSKPQNLGRAVNSEYWDSQPCLSHDGRTLYFSSARPGSFGGKDIWYTTLKDGKWSMAQNLGEPINSPGDEVSPFMHADGLTMYFSSNFHPGFGNQDLFVAYKNPLADAWGDPQNLGYPLNTVADESNIFINSKGDKGFINSTREGGFGKSDIYEFTLDEQYRPQVATFLRGTTRDSVTKKPVQARIRLEDVESGETVRQISSDKINGKFLMSLPLNREYAAFVEAPGYMFASKHFYLKQVEKEIYFDVFIDLKPIEKGTQIVLENIFFESASYELKETSKAELNFVVEFMTRNPKMEIEIQGHTDNVGTDSDNLTLSQNRANSVRQYIIDQGIESGRISAQGYGETIPVASNETDAGRAQNRRTEFKIIDL